MEKLKEALREGFKEKALFLQFREGEEIAIFRESSSTSLPAVGKIEEGWVEKICGILFPALLEDLKAGKPIRGEFPLPQIGKAQFLATKNEAKLYFPTAPEATITNYWETLLAPPAPVVLQETPAPVPQKPTEEPVISIAPTVVATPDPPQRQAQGVQVLTWEEILAAVSLEPPQ